MAQEKKSVTLDEDICYIIKDDVKMKRAKNFSARLQMLVLLGIQYEKLLEAEDGSDS